MGILYTQFPQRGFALDQSHNTHPVSFFYSSDPETRWQSRNPRNTWLGTKIA